MSGTGYVSKRCADVVSPAGLVLLSPSCWSAPDHQAHVAARFYSDWRIGVGQKPSAASSSHMQQGAPSSKASWRT